MAQTTPNMSLKTWDLLTDNFSHADLRANWLAVDQHDHTSGKGVQIGAGALANLAVSTPTIADLAVTGAKIADQAVTGAKISASAGILGSQLSSSAAVKAGQIGGGGGKVNIPAMQTGVSGTSYGTLTTPDQVTNIVLPTDGLIAVAYQATWQESVAGAARAAIFIGANQLKGAPQNETQGTAPLVQETFINPAAAVNTDVALMSTSVGLLSEGLGGAPAYAGDVTTGQLIGGIMAPPQTIGGGTFVAGGPCYIFAAAGTYTVSVQFKATSGSVTAKNRKLWVWTLGF